jgi:hypothetical protein
MKRQTIYSAVVTKHRQSPVLDGVAATEHPNTGMYQGYRHHIKALDEAGANFDIGMQLEAHLGLPQRIIFYTCELYVYIDPI